jgi:hypothetical protein
MRRIVLFSVIALASASCLRVASARAEGRGEGPAAEGTAAPSWFVEREEESANTGDFRIVSSRLMATPERARADAREKLNRVVGEWLAKAGIPRSWTPSKERVDRLIVDTHVESQVKPYATLYVAALRADFSPQRRDLIAQDYERQLVGGRLAMLAGGLMFVLISLAGVASYIRTDEATKGYYTTRLRLAALTGVGAAGWAIYKVLT